MRIFLGAITAILLSINSLAQGGEWKWAVSGLPNNHNYTNKLIVASNGDIVVAGSFTGSFTSGSVTLQSQGLQDIFIARYSPTGQMLWAKSAGGHSEDWGLGIAEDKAGNLYITGYFTDTATFGSVTLFSRDTLKSTPQVCNDIYLAKYDHAGNFIWVKQAGGPLRDRACTIAYDNTGYLYVGGQFASDKSVPPFSYATFDATVLTAYGSSGMFLAKYDTSGKLVWVKSAGGRYGSIIWGLTMDKQHNAFITGVFSYPYVYFDSIKLNSVNALSPGGMFVAKYDSSGHALWANGAGGNQTTVGFSIATDTLGNSFVTGLMQNDYTYFGNGYSLQGNVGFNNAYLAKYSSTGNLAWAKNVEVNHDDNNYCEGAVIIDKNLDIYITGTFSNESHFGGDTVMSYGFRDIMVCKYDSSGNPLSFTHAGGSTEDDGNDIAIDSSGNLYVTGVIGTPGATFGSHQLINNSGGYHIFLAKLAPYPNSVQTFTGNPANVYVFPNPSSGSFTFTYGSSAFDELTISNSLGAIIYQQALDPRKQSAGIHLPHIADGLYFLTASGKNGTIVRKFTIRN